MRSCQVPIGDLFLGKSGYLTAAAEWYVTGLTRELEGSMSPHAWESLTPVTIQFRLYLTAIGLSDPWPLAEITINLDTASQWVSKMGYVQRPGDPNTPYKPPKSRTP